MRLHSMHIMWVSLSMRRSSLAVHVLPQHVRNMCLACDETQQSCLLALLTSPRIIVFPASGTIQIDCGRDPRADTAGMLSRMSSSCRMANAYQIIKPTEANVAVAILLLVLATPTLLCIGPAHFGQANNN
jgi:hypothetical protein